MGSITKLLARVLSPFNAFILISLANQESMNGRAFSLRKRFTVPGSDKIDIALDPTAFDKNFLVFLPVTFNGRGGPVNIDIYSGVTEDGNGTVLPLFNRNFVIGTPPKTVARLNPTGVDITGLTPIEIYLPSDGTPAVASSGAETGDDLVANLDPTEKMLVRLTNTDSVAATVGVKSDFFEV